MRDAHKIGKLYGVGIGPGDPKLITLRAKEILDSADTIFVPKGKDESGSCARDIIEAVLSGKKSVVELVFPMTKDKSILKVYWSKAAKRIAGEIKAGKQAAFVTMGDPFIYSTYIYLLKTIASEFPQIEVETIPGITSFNAAASYVGLPLVERNEKLAVLAVTKDLAGVKKVIEEFDTIVLMKVGAKLEKVIGLLKKMKRAKDAVLATRIGHPDEKIIKDISMLKDKKLGYLSVIIVKRKNRSSLLW
jgi:precorrin-2/cobalt-factor-2 C20-methyltransferase